MSGLENLEARLQYRGGNAQIDRMKSSKIDSLRRALLYSYQSATAILNDGREFRCLINKDKTKISADDKIISIPFEDICLNEAEIKGSKKTSNGMQTIGIRPGDVFTWKETGTDWLVYLQRLEETAYFRAEIRNCRYNISIDNKNYKVYARKKDLGDISWRTTQGMSWNELDYSLEIYITKNDITKNYFKRFDIIELEGKPWEVQAADTMSVEGIVIVALKEYYSNTIEKEIEKEKQEKESVQPKPNAKIPQIKGSEIVYPYDEIEYTIANTSGGSWVINSTKAKILNSTDTSVVVAITTGRSGEFELKYVKENEEDIVLNVTIESL